LRDEGSMQFHQLHRSFAAQTAAQDDSELNVVALGRVVFTFRSQEMGNAPLSSGNLLFSKASK